MTVGTLKETKKGYNIPVSCPRCGDELHHVVSSRPMITEATAIAECDEGHRYQLVVRLLPVAADRTEERKQYRERMRALKDAV